MLETCDIYSFLFIQKEKATEHVEKIISMEDTGDQQSDKSDEKLAECFIKDINPPQQSGEKEYPESGQEVWLEKTTIPLMLTKLIFDI